MATVTATSRPQAEASRSLNGGYDYSIGTSIPANMPHAVSVSLPKWQDNVDYEEGRLTEVMQIGYPRFFIHKSIGKLAAVLARKFGTPAETAMLMPSSRTADRCRSYMRSQHAKAQASTSASPIDSTSLPVRVVQFSLVHPSNDTSAADSAEPSLSSAPIQLYIVLFPIASFPLAKSYWQHTGDGVSSRLAEQCLSILSDAGRIGGDESPKAPPRASVEDEAASSPAGGSEPVHRRYSKNRHYSRTNSSAGLALSQPPTPSTHASNDQDLLESAETPCGDQLTYVEERYGRNLPASSAPLAKQALKRRIAGTLLSDQMPQALEGRNSDLSTSQIETGDTARQGTELSEDDVFLYPCGMSAIFHAHQIALRWRRDTDGEARVGKSVCFGFPYTDTLKILQKWGPGCHFYGNGLDSDLDDFETLLSSQRANATEAPILSLFCEFPSNPLLRSPDLARIRRLADEYGFIVVIDETIGNFLNVEVLPYADIVVSSLTKVFSGDANVMGGSMVINPRGPQVCTLRKALLQEYEDTYFPIDAVFMERNSRDFASRIERIDINAEALADFMYDQCHNDSIGSKVIKGVFYPKFVAKANYDACRRQTNLYNRDSSSALRQGGGYGGLFSIIFHSTEASTAFYDALRCAKGPSLGTNFTLASPYTILAHYTELEWASQFGVERTLVRISTGLEQTDELLSMFTRALDEAKKLVA